MKIFNPIHRKVVNPASLSEVKNAYNILEQGHRQAIEASSKLRTEMANLDLNEAEDGWRQNKINEIEKVVNDNTRYGNSYEALDDIIAKSGDIASDAGMIGRLNAQKDFKQYQDKLDKRTDLPEDYKDYYKEKNKYHYQDKIDEKGRVVGGSKWTPTEDAVDVIPLSNLIVKGIGIAAKEQGGGTVATRWLDSNGHVTTDPTKAVDGEMYSTTTNSWTRLTEKKIRAGIKAMIETTPGAKASLEQDYKIAKWKMSKGENVEDVVDENGVILNEEDYLLKRVNPAVYASKYYNTIKKTTYGKGLANWRARSKAIADSQGINQNIKKGRLDALTGNGTPMRFEVDHSADFKQKENQAVNNIISLYKTITGSDISNRDLGTDLESIKKTMGNVFNNEDFLNNYSPVEIAKIKDNYNRQLIQYAEGVENMNTLLKGMTDDEKELIKANANIETGDVFNKDNKYNQKMVEAVKAIVGNNGASKIRISLNKEKDFEYIKNQLNAGRQGSAGEDGYIFNQSEHGYSIEVPTNNYNLIYHLSSATNKLNKNKSFFKSSDVKIDRLGEDFKNKNINITAPTYGDINMYTFSQLDEKRKEIKKRYDKTLARKGTNNIIVGTDILPGNSFTQNKLLSERKQGALDNATFNLYNKFNNGEIDKIILDTEYTAVPIYKANGENGSGVLEEVTDSDIRAKIGKQIKLNSINKKLKASLTITGKGEYATALTYMEYDNSGSETGNIVNCIIPGLIREDEAEKFVNNPKVKSRAKLIKNNALPGTTILYGIPSDDNFMGRQKIKSIGNNNFLYTNGSESYTLDINDAIELDGVLNQCNSILSSFGGTDLTGKENRIKSVLDNLASKIEYIVGKNEASIMKAEMLQKLNITTNVE